MERYREPPTPIAGSVLSTFVTKEGLIPLSCFTKKGEYFVLRSGEDEGFRPIFPTRALRAKLLDLIQNDEIPASAIQLAPSEFVKASDITSKELLTEEKLFGKVLTEDSFRKLIGRQFAVYAYPDDKDPRRALMTPLYELQYLLKSDNAKETSGLIEEVIDTTLNTNVNCDKYIFNHQGKQVVRDRLIHLVYDKVKGCIDLLPALPLAWPTGSFRGLCARGAFEVDCDWQDGRPVRVTVRSLKGLKPDVRFGGQPVTPDVLTVRGMPL